VAIMRVRVRLGAGLARLADAPLLAVDLPEEATIERLLEALAAAHPGIAPALPSVLPVVKGVHAARGDVLQNGTEVALLIPVAGG
jgi:molybdopterin converting factor small subunit